MPIFNVTVGELHRHHVTYRIAAATAAEALALVLEDSEGEETHDEFQECTERYRIPWKKPEEVKPNAPV